MKHFILTLIIAVVALMSAAGHASAQSKDDRPYNLQKAYEILQNDRDEEQALKLLSDQIKSTPDNV